MSGRNHQPSPVAGSSRALRWNEWAILALIFAVVGLPPLGLALYAASGPAAENMATPAELRSEEVQRTLEAARSGP